MNKHALQQSMEYIGSWLRYRYEREEVPGFVVAIAHKGKVVMNEAYGYADLKKQTKLTPHHIFRIASHSKTFTATAVLQLQEQGKLRIDDTVVTYLAWLAKHSDARWSNVTIRQLLSHSAGVIRDGFDADYWQLDRPFPDAQQLKTEIMRAGLVIDTNVKMKYSNYGYSLLGLLIEEVTGLSYSSYVQKNIVEVLALDSTGPEYTSEIDGRLVTGYSRRDVHKRRLPIAQIDTRAMAAATGFYSNAADLCAYFSAHFVGSGKLLNDESKKEMQRVQWHAKTPGQSNREDYGLGLEIEHLKKRVTISHGGGFPGHITKTIADPKDELVVTVLTNCLGSPASIIAKSIFGIIDYFQTKALSSKAKHDMTSVAGRYMNLWSTSDIVVVGDSIVTASPDSWQPLTHPEELEYVDADTLRVAQAGSFDSEGEVVRFNREGDRIATVNYCGMTLWPEEQWLSRQKGRSIVE